MTGLGRQGGAEAAKGGRRHLLSIAELGAEGIEEILEVSDAFVEVGRRSIPKVPSLRGRTVVTLFAEQSTRTRLSFETAAKRLSADVLSFSVDTSSLKKGESLETPWRPWPPWEWTRSSSGTRRPELPLPWLAGSTRRS